METQNILKLRAMHQRMGKSLENEMERLQATASKADTPEKRNRVTKWQLALKSRIEYYNAIDDLLDPQALEELARAKAQSHAIKSNSQEQLEERNNYLRWRLESAFKEVELLKRKWLIAKQLLEEHTSINPSLVSWMKPEDVGLNYLKTA